MRVLVLAAALGLVAVSGGSGAESTARLRLAAIVPPVVAGTGFEPRERVVVTLAVRRAVRSKTVRASSAGSFAARFDPLLALEPCEGVVVARATGSHGSRAVLRRACRPPHRVR
jgi:hypothetical protein